MLYQIDCVAPVASAVPQLVSSTPVWDICMQFILKRVSAWKMRKILKVKDTCLLLFFGRICESLERFGKRAPSIECRWCCFCHFVREENILLVAEWSWKRITCVLYINICAWIVMAIRPLLLDAYHTEQWDGSRKIAGWNGWNEVIIALLQAHEECDATISYGTPTYDVQYVSERKRSKQQYSEWKIKIQVSTFSYWRYDWARAF